MGTIINNLWQIRSPSQGEMDECIKTLNKYYTKYATYSNNINSIIFSLVSRMICAQNKHKRRLKHVL